MEIHRNEKLGLTNDTNVPSGTRTVGELMRYILGTIVQISGAVTIIVTAAIIEVYA